MTSSGAPAVFLDRDGTLIVEKHYLSDPAQVRLEDGVLEGLKLLQRLELPLIVLSNQSGIGRGLLTETDARRVNARAAELLWEGGVEIAGWYLCPHAPDAVCECRKPLPGLAVAAAGDRGLRLNGSYVIGDKRSDVELADAIGGTGILLTTGHGMQSAPWARLAGRPVFSNLQAAAEFIEFREGA